MNIKMRLYGFEEISWKPFCMTTITWLILRQLVMVSLENCGQFSTQHRFLCDMALIANVFQSVCFVLFSLDEVKTPKWIVDLLYMCLINIGDSYRYLHDTAVKAALDEEEQECYLNQAKDFYIQVSY